MCKLNSSLGKLRLEADIAARNICWYLNGLKLIEHFIFDGCFHNITLVSVKGGWHGSKMGSCLETSSYFFPLWARLLSVSA